ncbi:phosphate starvation protein [Bacillus phage vB_BcgM]|nr:phosphate starvation protein [Bacillus phage vB_BcgM]
MTNTNDAVVLQLQGKVDEKKKKLAALKKGRHTSSTKCILEWEGKNINFNVVGKDELTFLLVKIHALFVAADDLLLEDFGDTVVQGHSLDEWILDIKGKIKEKDILNEEQQVKAIEKKLDAMLSKEKKDELELAKFAELLK